jgi:hypothetical protein
MLLSQAPAFMDRTFAILSRTSPAPITLIVRTGGDHAVNVREILGIGIIGNGMRWNRQGLES